MVNEAILKKTNDRFAIFPIQHQDIWQLYKKALSTFWTVEEINLSKDKEEWDGKLDAAEDSLLKIY